MAIEIVDLPIKKWWFSIVFRMFARGYESHWKSVGYMALSAKVGCPIPSLLIISKDCPIYRRVSRSGCTAAPSNYIASHNFERLSHIPESIPLRVHSRPQQLVLAIQASRAPFNWHRGIRRPDRTILGQKNHIRWQNDPQLDGLDVHPAQSKWFLIHIYI